MIIHALPFPETRAPPREYEKTPRLGRVPVSLKSWYQNLRAPELNFQNKIFRKNNLIPRVLSYLSLRRAVSQWYGHPRVLGIRIPISLTFWASPVGDAENADRFDFA